MNSNLRWGLLLALLPAAATAQTTPHVYVGASAVLLRTAPFSSYSSNHAGPAATIGVQFNERWAVETGFQSVWYTRFDAQDYLINNERVNYAITVRSLYFLIPVLARLTLTQAESPLRVDLLGGLNVMHGRTTVTQRITENGVTTASDYSGSGTSASLALGPQVRYVLGASFEAKLNVPVNMYLDRNEGNFGNRLFLNPQLGVQYTFH